MSISISKNTTHNFVYAPKIEVNLRYENFSRHFTRYDLELREIETQSREFQKLAVRLFSEGHLSISKNILQRREKILGRMDEVRDILIKQSLV